jgi:hypothetical protein
MIYQYENLKTRKTRNIGASTKVMGRKGFVNCKNLTIYIVSAIGLKLHPSKSKDLGIVTKYVFEDIET